MTTRQAETLLPEPTHLIGTDGTSAAAQIGIATLAQARAAMGVPTEAALTAHIEDETNPHGVTAAQTEALPLAGGTVTGGVIVPNGTVAGALTAEAHSGGVWRTSNNVTIPATNGFTATIIAGGAHTVGAGGAAVTLALNEALTLMVVGGVIYHTEPVALEILPQE